VAIADRMREQSEGCVKRNPTEADAADAAVDDDETEHQKGDFTSSKECSEVRTTVLTQRSEGRSVMVMRADGWLVVVAV
jgi:hypothetical protein